MVKVGDRVRLSSGKAPDREGIVTAVTGSMLRVRWPSEEESTVVPAPGTLTVLTTPPTRPGRAAPKRAAAKKATPAKKTATAKKATPTKKATPAKKTATTNATRARRSSR
jgi:hypothetical protein